MKRSLALIGLLLAAIAVVAQRPNFWVERADIPFAFVVDGTTVLPPGEYQFSWNACGVLIVRGTENDKLHAVAMGSSLDGSAVGKRPTLTFHNFGDAYFLANVTYPQVGRLVMAKTTRQLELEKGVSSRREVTVAGQ